MPIPFLQSPDFIKAYRSGIAECSDPTLLEMELLMYRFSTLDGAISVMKQDNLARGFDYPLDPTHPSVIASNEIAIFAHPHFLDEVNRRGLQHLLSTR